MDAVNDFRTTLAQAGITPDKPLHATLTTIHDTAIALDARVASLSNDGIAKQFRFEAVKAWRTVVPNFTKTILWTRRLAIIRDVVLMVCGVTIAVLVWWRPTIDINAAAVQCAQNQTISDGGVYCTMRVWVKPPTKGKE
jgi:hypothetical protein